MCILRVCCCLLKVSEVRVFLLGTERGVLASAAEHCHTARRVPVNRPGL